MSINIGDNFSYLGKKFLDDREHFDTVAKMKACNDVPNGFITYCDETNTRYEYHTDNEEDATLGKWRVFKSVPDVNSDDYVTQDELEEAIKDVDVTSQLESYATKDYVDDIQIGGRNYVLDTAKTIEIVGENITNQGKNIFTFSESGAMSGKTFTISFTYEITDYVSGKFKLQTSGGSYHNITISITPTGNGIFEYAETRSDIEEGEEFTRVQLRLDNFQGTIKIHEKTLKIELGDKATDWTPAPEDNVTQEQLEEGLKSVEVDLTGIPICEVNETEPTDEDVIIWLNPNASEEEIDLDLPNNIVLFETDDTEEDAFITENDIIANLRLVIEDEGLSMYYKDTLLNTVELVMGEKVECTYIALDKENVTGYIFSQVQLTETILPSDCTSKVVWTTKSQSIASVSGGLVTMKGVGECVIYANCGSQTATATIKVQLPTVVAGSLYYNTEGVATYTQSANKRATLNPLLIKVEEGKTYRISCESDGYYFGITGWTIDESLTTADFLTSGASTDFSATRSIDVGWKQSSYDITMTDCNAIGITFKNSESTALTTEDIEALNSLLTIEEVN